MQYTQTTGKRTWLWYLAVVIVVASSVTSGVTTFTGARELVNDSVWVALCFTLAIQGGLFVVIHHASESSRPRRILLAFAWCCFAFFSVYSSGIGFYKLQQKSLKSEYTHTSLREQWRVAEKSIAETKRNMLAWLNEAKQPMKLSLKIEETGERAARREKKPFSPQHKLELKSQLDALNEAERKVQAIQPLSGSMPDAITEAVQKLDAAFAAVNDAYAALPEVGKARCPVPTRPVGDDLPEETQQAFWKGLKSGSMPVLVMLTLALILDLLPVIFSRAIQPKRMMSQKIISFRRSVRDIWGALRSPLSPSTLPIHLIVEGYDLDAMFQYPVNQSLTLADVRRDLALLASEVSKEAGREMKLVSTRTQSGMELVPDLPVLSQLAEDRTIIVSFDPE